MATLETVLPWTELLDDEQLADAPVLPPIEYRLDHAGCGCCDGDNEACDCLYHPGALRSVATRRWNARKAAKAAAGEG